MAPRASSSDTKVIETARNRGATLDLHLVGINVARLPDDVDGGTPNAVDAWAETIRSFARLVMDNEEVVFLFVCETTSELETFSVVDLCRAWKEG